MDMKVHTREIQQHLDSHGIKTQKNDSDDKTNQRPPPPKKKKRTDERTWQLYDNQDHQSNEPTKKRNDGNDFLQSTAFRGANITHVSPRRTFVKRTGQQPFCPLFLVSCKCVPLLFPFPRLLHTHKKKVGSPTTTSHKKKKNQLGPFGTNLFEPTHPTPSHPHPLGRRSHPPTPSSISIRSSMQQACRKRSSFTYLSRIHDGPIQFTSSPPALLQRRVQDAPFILMGNFFFLSLRSVYIPKPFAFPP